MNKKLDFIFGMLFLIATVLFIVVFLTNDLFFNWAFERHKNILSWYIRPLFIIPIVFFALKRSWVGIFSSIFSLFTSMFWFPEPEITNLYVVEFLQFEMEYLKGVWNAPKIIMSLAVPIFFIVLVMVAWKRNWKWLLIIVVAAALLKILWSVLFSGEAGMSILKPAIAGLLVCIGCIYYYQKKHISK